MPVLVSYEVLATYLLDMAGARKWIERALPGASVEIKEVDPIGLPKLIKEPAASYGAVPSGNYGAAPSGNEAKPSKARTPRRTVKIEWVDTAEKLGLVCQALEQEQKIGLDVATTLRSGALSLIQISTSSRTYLIDAFEIVDFSNLEQVFRSKGVTKVIHNVSFKRKVLEQHAIALDGVVDTFEWSRKLRGQEVAGGHGLKEVCKRELGIDMAKAEQISDWSQRPLSRAQMACAALNVEIMLLLYERLRAAEAGDSTDGGKQGQALI